MVDLGTITVTFAAVTAAIAVVYVFVNFFKIKSLDEGTPEMIEKARIIRSGARTFVGTEFIRIGIVALIIAILISCFIERTAGITLMIGAFVSSAACVLGMEDSTYANVRTANRARETESLSDTLQVALLGGSVPGLSVQAFLIAGFVAVLLIYGGPKFDDPGSGIFATFGNTNASIMRLTTFSLGASIVAMFSRVAGGNYTKAADISSDIVGKNRYGLDEDDARIPNVIADFIGDNVNDIAGNCSDLLESTGAATIAASLIGHNMYSGTTGVSDRLYSTITLYPILVLAGGLLSCFIGLILVIQLRKSRKSPSQEINLVSYASAGLTAFVSLLITFFAFNNVELFSEFTCGWISPWLATLLGIGCGVLVGLFTEFYTSTDPIKNKLLRKIFKVRPTTRLSEIAHEGEAFEVTLGDALGFRSVLLPGVFIAMSIFFAEKLAGDYGMAMAALGMLSFVGATVTIDAFGPIADNAGGLAEACGLGEGIRKITDELDGVGNTTAAIGKGFAICSADLAAASLIKSFIGTYTPAGQPLVLNFASGNTFAGATVGMALVCYFIYILSKNTIEAAAKMADEGDKMLKNTLENGTPPDYNKIIKMATKEALSRMVAPSMIALVVPLLVGITFGLEFLGGMLAGSTLIAVGLAIFMGNSGGAFDNAKKYVEQGLLNGLSKLNNKELYDLVHRVVVACDTIGDTRKDVVGVALDIFIKIMSTVAITMAPLFMAFCLFS